MTFKKGHTVSKETRNKISLANIGSKNVLNFTKEQREKANKNLKSYNEYPEEIKERIRKGWFKKGHSPLIFGENHHRWKGGISFEPYGKEFNRKLKEQIRKRDGYTCQNCNNSQIMEKLSVHHIDENKKNNNKNNLISLCRLCHAKLHNNLKVDL